MYKSKAKRISFSQAQWIWLPGEPAPRNTIAEFRRSFRLKGRPSDALLLISADSRYTVWVNGERIGYGPPRNFPNHYEFDTHEVGRLLRRGENSLVVLVQHWGEGNIQSFVSRAGLIAEIQANGVAIMATNAAWQCRRSPAYEPITPRIACMMSFEEQALGVTEAANGIWGCASTIGPAGCPPWGKLSARTIPLLTDEPWECVAAKDEGIVTGAPLVLSLRAGLMLDPAHRSMNSVAVDGLFCTILRVPSDGELWIKQGAMYSGPVSLCFDGTPLKLEQDAFDLRATRRVKKGDHLLVLDWKGIAHDLDIGIAVGGIPGVAQAAFGGNAAAYWLYLPGGKGRPLARRATSPKELNTAVWECVPQEAVPKHDVYMAVTCRERQSSGEALPVTLPATVPVLPGSGTARRLVLDFGRHTNGFVELDLEAGAGTVLEAAGVEGINFGQIQFTELNNNTLSYRCAEGRQTFTSLLPRGLRYLVLDVKPVGRAAIFHAARMRVSTYPWRPTGSFRCSDARLNQIYELCVNTLRMTSMDTFVDATYEQALWVGDAASMSTQVHHYVQGDSLLPDRCLRVAAQSLERMPLVNSQVPSAWENRPIPNWSFLWALGVRDHFLFSGDLAFARDLLPALEKQARFIDYSLDREGLFAMHGEVWHFLDWNGSEDDHRTSATRTYASENALAIASLRATAEVAAALGNAAAARRWSALAKKMGAATRRAFWNAAQDAFAETRAEGAASATITASTQVCALMAGLFPGTKVRQAARNLIEPPMGWLATGTPWMWALGARHSLESGWTEQVLSGMRRFWGGMLDRGATTAWEMFEGRHRPGLPTRSWCHGWSAGPAWLLPAYVLGVRPASPGWKSVTISPLCGDLQWAEGTVPTPHGIIRVRWERRPDRSLCLETELPRGVRILGS